MTTKKKVATKVAGKKAVNSKKVEPAKKTGKPVLHTATHKSLSKHAPKPAEKKVLASGGHTKKVAPPAAKHVDKSSAAKPSKTHSKTAIPLKTEPIKNTSKKLENKSHENKSHENKSHDNKSHENIVNQPTPPAAKQAQKKEAPEVKPLKEAVVAKPAKEVAATKPTKEAAATKQAKETHAVKAPKVTMPDIKTKTVRKYEPDFTKSVLDTPMHDQSAPSQRYSDTDLNEFRELINKKLDAAKKELNYLQGLITRKDEMGGDESDNRYMTMEDGSISMEREQLSQMASRQITFIDHLEKAIMRIENKTYGICRVTGKLIDKARLRAVPHATLSIEAKQTMNK